VGAQKAGTTSLHDILYQHPEVFLPINKEAHFFDEDEKYALGFKWYYENFFSDRKNEKICGSCTPEYMYFDKVPKRIFESCGREVKLIFLLRNPVDRAYSHYLMSKRRCLEELSFEAALKEENSRIKTGYLNKSNFSYGTRGFYFSQIKRYLEYFPKKNMMFIRFEDDFVNNRAKTVEEILQFLDLKQIDLDVNIKSNEARSSRIKAIQRFIYKPNVIKSFFSFFVNQQMKSKIRLMIYDKVMRPEKKSNINIELKNSLIRSYLEDITELEKLIGKSLSSWKNESNS
jgi:hypothetical protein